MNKNISLPRSTGLCKVTRVIYKTAELFEISFRFLSGLIFEKSVMYTDNSRPCCRDTEERKQQNQEGVLQLTAISKCFGLGWFPTGGPRLSSCGSLRNEASGLQTAAGSSKGPCAEMPLLICKVFTYSSQSLHQFSFFGNPH